MPVPHQSKVVRVSTRNVRVDPVCPGRALPHRSRICRDSGRAVVRRGTRLFGFSPPTLHYVRGGPRFDPARRRAKHLGDPNELENSKDRRTAGGHGNQHVRLRSAQIDEAICPTLAAICCSSRAGVRPPPSSRRRYPQLPPNRKVEIAKLVRSAATGPAL
jgi:hypothetical protein